MARRLPDPRRWRAWFQGVRSWRRWLCAFMLGAIAVLALPPVYLVPALIPAFTGLMWLTEGCARGRSALAVGFWFALGYFSLGLYWVANALLTKPEQFGWFAPFAPVGLALILAPMAAPATWIAWRSRATGFGRVLVFAGAWTILEWARSWLLTGFPWNLIGSVWCFSDAMIQITSVIGTYGLGLLTVIAAAWPASFGAGDEPRRRAWIEGLVAYGLLALVAVFGWARLTLAPPVEFVEGVRLRLVQPNIPQNLKWRRDLVERHLLLQLRLGATPSDPPPTHVVWSEAAAPVLLANDPRLIELVGKLTPPGGLTILGTLRRSETEPPEHFNSLVAIDDQGAPRAVYDKGHLVPFGEYMPLGRLLNLGSIAGGMTFLSAGPGLTTLRLPGLPPVSPLICYEIIFPGAVARADDRPDWLLNLTNDGWYGISAGPYQHFATARLRAVEEGLPLVRVANTGISAFVDPYGRVLAALALGEQGYLDGSLPRPLAAPTLYARFGDAVPIALAIIASLVGIGLSNRFQRVGLTKRQR